MIEYQIFLKSFRKTNIQLFAIGADFATSNDGGVFKGGFCAPFDVAILVLTLGGAYIQNNWDENFGHSSGGSVGADDTIKVLKKGKRDFTCQLATCQCEALTRTTAALPLGRVTPRPRLRPWPLFESNRSPQASTPSFTTRLFSSAG